MDNRKVKSLLIQHFGEEICFLYPKDRTKSQMIFSNKLQTTDLIENLRATDPVITAAKLLREETQQYDFLIDDSFSGSSDLVESREIYQNRQPEMWKKFFDVLLPRRKYYDGLQRKSDTIYQIVHATITKKETPLHVFVAQAVFEPLPSKRVITILNRLALSISYCEMMRIDTRLAKRTIMEAGNFRVPVGQTIESGTIIEGVMDNFDHDENTMSGKNGSHDTILTLFQKNDVDKPPQDIIRNVPENLKSTEDEGTLHYILLCQLINKTRKLVKEAKLQMTLFLLVSLSI